jgi:ABC-type glutathione transport system ATPase component
MTDTVSPLLAIDGLSVAAGATRILDSVSMTARSGRTTGVVGESGSGKSMTALAVLGLLPPGVEATSGRILFDGRDLMTLSPRERRLVRGKEIAMVFQDPLAALNPVMRIDDQIGEILRRRDGLSRRAARAAAVELLDRVDMPDPAYRAASYPHQLSGGQRQRVVIAMALAGTPRLILADEPTTALDVTVQSRILELLRRLQREEDLSILLVSHDLRVMAHFADDLVVMQRGVVVESGPCESVLAEPEDPYTQRLIENVPAVHA